MHVSHLSLTDFRSYTQVELPLDPGVTALVGPNGQGKTNLVEALGYVATLGSHRVSSDAALVRAGTERAIVRSKVVRGTRSALVEIEIAAGRANRARLNGSAVPRVRDVLGTLRTVLFAPEDLALVKGDPDGRRRFLDDLTVLVRPRMASVLQDYGRILKQRSTLLKTAGAASRSSRGGLDLRTLDIWDAKLAQVGAQIVVGRLGLVEALAPHVLSSYEQVSSGQGAAIITYSSSLENALRGDEGGRGSQYEVEPAGGPVGASSLVGASVDLVEARLLEAMGRLRTREIERGVCLVGPHRDDLVLTLGGLPAKGYASHGESWSFALALRLASYALMSQPPGPDASAAAIDLWESSPGEDGEPVLILDDVFAELDVRRRERLAALVAPAGQVLITAAVPGDVPEELEGARVDVMAGEVTRVR